MSAPLPCGVEEPVVELRGLVRTYPGSPPVEAVRGVDLVVRRGDYLALSGPSGSGKSTLLNLLALLDRPDAGNYLFEGDDVGGLGESGRCGLRASRIGVVFQAFHLLAYRSALDNVALGLLYTGMSRKQRRARASSALEKVALGHRALSLSSTLSGGERQRVAVARALVADPSVLLCDEPTGNLDSASTSSLLDLLDDLHGEGVTMVVITHDPQVANRAARHLVMGDGRLSEQEAC